MTGRTPAEQFRSDSDKRMMLEDALSNPILQEAFAIVSEVPTDVILGLSFGDMGRLLGEIQANARFVPKLLELSTPLPPQKAQPSESFGTPHTVEEFDQVNVP